jgi:hypothetical protein
MNATFTTPRLLLALLSILLTVTLNAQDRLFTYTYQSTVLNAGQKELEVWNTLRAGRDNFYARLDNRTEFEVGLGKNFQTAFYLNLTSKTSAEGPDTAMVLVTENEIGFSNEWKYKLLDPVANAFGLAFYVEAGIASNEFELEGKLIIDKVVKDFTIAGNGVYELEMKPYIENGSTSWEYESKADLYLAVAYSFNPRFHLTLENGFRNVFAGGELLHSAFYSGPGFSYVKNSFWINFTALPQWISFNGETEGSARNLNEYEKIQLRLLFSYVF